MGDTDPKEARRQEILAAALAAFSEKGYDKTSVDDIVRASGLSKGTLYWHFKNKEAIFTALVQQVFDQISMVFHQSLGDTQDLSPPDRLKQVFIAFMPMMNEADSWMRLYTDFFSQAWQMESVRTALYDAYMQYVDEVQPIIQQGIDAGYFRELDSRTVAQTFVGALDGYWFQQMLGAGNAEETIKLYSDLMIRGLLKDHDQP